MLEEKGKYIISKPEGRKHVIGSKYGIYIKNWSMLQFLHGSRGDELRCPRLRNFWKKHIKLEMYFIRFFFLNKFLSILHLGVIFERFRHRVLNMFMVRKTGNYKTGACSSFQV